MLNNLTFTGEGLRCFEKMCADTLGFIALLPYIDSVLTKEPLL